MQKKFFRLFLAALAYVLVFNLGCNKIDTTNLGADLIPAVDNVFTFADTFFINASREQIIDSTRLFRTENHVLGSIGNDPVFGKLKADVFLQLKPSFFPFYFGNRGDTINPSLNPATHYDSVFLCLSYKGFYGDTTKAQHLKVYQLDQNTSNFTDTVLHLLNFQPNQPYLGNLLGEATVNQTDLKNFTFLKTSRKDSITRQIRIKLSTSFLNAFVSNDSGQNRPNNFFYKDSIFKEKYKGFAIVADGASGANGLFYIGLTDAATRLEVHYVAGNANKLDTAFASLPVSVGSFAAVSASANANYIEKDTSSSEFANSPDIGALYLQTAPGSAISFKIPQLELLTNRVIHRAEIFLEQIPGSSQQNAVLAAPQYLYLDLIDTVSPKRYKPLYFDLSPNEFYNPDNAALFFPSQGIDQSYYGGFERKAADAFGSRSFYTFNLTRYVQNLVTQKTTNYAFRVYAPYNLNYYGFKLIYKNNLAFGRVKIANGNNTNNRLRLRMRIVYSNI